MGTFGKGETLGNRKSIDGSTESRPTVFLAFDRFFRGVDQSGVIDRHSLPRRNVPEIPSLQLSPRRAGREGRSDSIGETPMDATRRVALPRKSPRIEALFNLRQTTISDVKSRQPGVWRTAPHVAGQIWPDRQRGKGNLPFDVSFLWAPSGRVRLCGTVNRLTARRSLAPPFIEDIPDGP
jgi:hypothetical protein